MYLSKKQKKNTLDAGSTVTFLLRSPTTFDDDEIIQKHVKSGKARLVQGDGLVVADVRNVWAVASRDKPVDVLLFTVGFSEYMSIAHLSKVYINPCLAFQLETQNSIRSKVFSCLLTTLSPNVSSTFSAKCQKPTLFRK